MRNDYTYIGCVLDRSGSMGSMGKIEEARSGFNNFIDEQKKLDGKADINVTIFDDAIEKLYQGDINSCPQLNSTNFFPRGMTAYLDALGKTINSIGEELSKMHENERPSKVIVLVITDGLENASQEFTSNAIKNMIEEQRNKYSWEFVFMGSDESSLEQAQDIGIKNVFAYDDSAKGSREAYLNVASLARAYRTTGDIYGEDEDLKKKENYVSSSNSR